MPEKKLFKYYAFRMSDIVVIRKTTQKLKKVKSVLRNPTTSFVLEQVTIIGGLIVGTIKYTEFNSRTKIVLSNLQCKPIERATARGLLPFMNTGE